MMEQIRTRIIYGAGTVAGVGRVVREFGNAVKLVAGGMGEIPQNLRDRIFQSLEYFGVPINGTEEYDCLLVIGGGSKTDAAKIWSMQMANPDKKTEDFFNGFKPEKALPIIAVPTMAASGSETNGGYVMTIDGVKRGSSAWAAIPKVAILDPELTLTVPRDLTAYGLIDAYSHVLEGYLFGERTSNVADAMAEAVMERINAVSIKLYDNPSDIEARGEAMLLSNVANDGSLNVGRGKVAWKIHEQAHKMPDIYHGKAVAISMLDYFKSSDKELYDEMTRWFDRIGINLEEETP